MRVVGALKASESGQRVEEAEIPSVKTRLSCIESLTVPKGVPLVPSSRFASAVELRGVAFDVARSCSTDISSSLPISGANGLLPRRVCPRGADAIIGVCMRARKTAWLLVVAIQVCTYLPIYLISSQTRVSTNRGPTRSCKVRET